jgi:hypothetical protein
MGALHYLDLPRRCWAMTQTSTTIKRLLRIALQQAEADVARVIARPDWKPHSAPSGSAPA